MIDIVSLLPLAAGAAVFGVGIGAQIIAHRTRKVWSSSGMGLEERATGLASLAASAVLFPSELETAKATNTELAVVVMRRFSEHPEVFGRRLADAIRAHETGWRIDYDIFAATLLVEDRDAAVRAAKRIGLAACGSESSRDLRIGIAMCPSDTDALLDAVDIAARRMRSFSVFAAVASQLDGDQKTANSSPESEELAA